MKVSVKLNEKEVLAAELSDDLREVSSEEFLYEFVKITMLQAQEETERAGIEADFETIDIQMVPVE